MQPAWSIFPNTHANSLLTMPTFIIYKPADFLICKVLQDLKFLVQVNTMCTCIIHKTNQ